MKISKIANWMTIISGIITIITFLATITGRLQNLRYGSGVLSVNTVGVSIILVGIIWLFFFLVQYKIALRFAKKHDELITFFVAIGACVFGGIFFLAVGLAVINSIVGEKALVWMAIPVALWIGTSIFSVLFVTSEAQD